MDQENGGQPVLEHLLPTLLEVPRVRSELGCRE
jgi:hypothetical protein